MRAIRVQDFRMSEIATMTSFDKSPFQYECLSRVNSVRFLLRRMLPGINYLYTIMGMQMARYFGVHCASCEKLVPLAVCRVDQGREITGYMVPLEPVYCRKCGSKHRYASSDSLYFDGPDGLLKFRPL
jgi:hypothetical protein